MTNMMKKFKFGSFGALAILLVFIYACSDNGTDSDYPRTKYPQIKDYSRKTIVGTVINADSVPQAHARIYITGVDSTTQHAYIMDSTEADKNGYYSIVTDGDKHRYRLLAKTTTDPDTLFGFETYVYTLWDTPYPDTFEFNIEVGEPASVQFYLRYRDYDSICLEGSFACATITENDREKGFVIIRDVPPGFYETYTGWRDGKVIANPLLLRPKNIRAGSTYYWANGFLKGHEAGTLDLSIPPKALAILDSAKLPHILNNLIIPVFKKENYDALMDDRGNEIIMSKAKNETDSSRFWIIPDSIGYANQKIRWIDAFDQNEQRQKRNLWLLYSKINADSIDIGHNFNPWDSSYAVSFWIESLSDSRKQVSLVSVGNDSLGFKITQCPKNTQQICMRILDKNDSTSIDSTIYCSEKIFDSKRHHLSIVIHKDLVMIAIDGKTVYETSMDLTMNFFKALRYSIIGDIPMKDFIVYKMDKDIRTPKDNDWTRLKAWLMAFYELQASVSSDK